VAGGVSSAEIEARKLKRRNVKDNFIANIAQPKANRLAHGRGQKKAEEVKSTVQSHSSGRKGKTQG